MGIYLNEFTDNEREISIPYEAADCDIENFEIKVIAFLILQIFVVTSS